MGGDGWKEMRLAGPVGAVPVVLRSCSRTLCMIRLGFGKILSNDGGKVEEQARQECSQEALLFWSSA